MQRILSVAPATGWSAIFLEDKEPYFIVAPLAVWAVVETCSARDCDFDEHDCEHGRYTEIKGFAGVDVDEPCSNVANFHMYVYDSNASDKRWQQGWIEAAKKRIEKQNRQ